MRFTVINLGCKVNAYEAESVASAMQKRGWERVKDNEDYDAVLIFTCAVTNTAASKSRQMLHRAKRSHPDAVTCMIGCYVQVDADEIEDADILVGTKDKEKTPLLIEQYLKDHQKIRAVEDLGDMSFHKEEASLSDSKARCDLKIQDGCNQFCTYCIIPYARGRERSLDPDTVVKEAERLSQKYHEIVLTGIHTGRYGREYGVTLAELMKQILAHTEDCRLRISSIEVTEVSDELIELMKEEPRIARFLHIPLQSGSDTVLKRMHRPYDTAYYYDRICKVRNALSDDISVSCDIMTGFPGESEQEFQETMDFLKKCQFSFLHVFPFSLRKGTQAEKMPCQIPVQVKKERASECIQLSRNMEDAYRSSFVGKEADIIAEWVRDGCTTGHTSNYIPVRIEQEFTHGEWVHVKLTEYKNHTMYAEKIR